MILVDTNVLVDILEDDPEWVEWSLSQIYGQSKIHQPIINPIIYAELSLTFSTHETLNEAIDEMRLEIIDIPGQPYSLPERPLPSIADGMVKSRTCWRISLLARTPPFRITPF